MFRMASTLEHGCANDVFSTLNDASGHVLNISMNILFHVLMKREHRHSNSVLKGVTMQNAAWCSEYALISCKIIHIN